MSIIIEMVCEFMSNLSSAAQKSIEYSMQLYISLSAHVHCMCTILLIFQD